MQGTIDWPHKAFAPDVIAGIMTTAMLTKEKLDQIESEFRDQGYSVVDGLFSPEECLSIQRIAETLPSFTSGDLLPVMNPHRDRPELLDTMSDERVVTVVRRLMKGKPAGMQTQYFYTRPGTRGFSFHQDNFYVQAGKDRFVSAWLALEDVTADNGALIVLPGSHRDGILEVREIPQPSTFGQDPNHNRRECVVEKDYAHLSVAVRQGGVVFLHGHLVHSSNHNTTVDQFRRVLLMTYLAEGSDFRPGFIANRTPFALKA
jgi:ectoine hydroxylase-related dioxygenase (phytanoyl-CoA dioxygenase family)